MRLSRRRFLELTAAGAAGLALPYRAAADPAASRAGEWDAGELAHLIPAANHERFRIKASFQRPLDAAPELRAGSRSTRGVRTDSQGRFWSFDLAGFDPATRHRLELRDAAGKPLCESWDLATFPAPDAEPASFRVLIYTCAGGEDNLLLPDGRPLFLPMVDRRRLLNRGLSFAPDAVLAVGDHIYKDQLSGVMRTLGRFQGGDQHGGELDPLGRSLLLDGPMHQAMRDRMEGTRLPIFDRSQPVLGGPNEGLLVEIANHQIANLYGTALRSVPSFLTQDDHDHFENDSTSASYVTFPPDPFMLRAARATQRLYYPELFPDRNLPRGLAGVDAGDRPPECSESYGSVRWGRLAELLLFDCRRHLSLKGPSAGFVPPETESWLIGRLGARDVAHVAAVPSTPVAWSAGKWLEWYPDLLGPDGALSAGRDKPYWQEGWFSQHNRLLEAAHRREGVPLFVSGDLHSIASGRILRSRELDLRSNPVVSLLAGPLGSGVIWPSNSLSRGVRGTPPEWLEVDETLPCVENNGFTLLDFTPEAIEVRQFRWLPGASSEPIETLQPFHTERLERPA